MSRVTAFASGRGNLAQDEKVAVQQIELHPLFPAADVLPARIQLAARNGAWPERAATAACEVWGITVAAHRRKTARIRRMLTPSTLCPSF